MQYIPIEVVRKCRRLLRVEELILRDPIGRSWRARMFHRKTYCKGKPEVHISTGWLQFARGNKLKLDDRCIFRFAPQGKKEVVNVQIVQRAIGSSL